MVRVCIIGAGPSGMSAVLQFRQMDSPPDFECYEKQGTWGGLWNYTWRTGTDEWGEPVHGGMYKYLWSNGPKECLEYPDYTFDHHFGKPIPSFLPRAVIRDYLEGRWQSSKLADLVKFNHVVRNVKYREKSDDFLVTVEKLGERKRNEEVFSHVIVAVGIFNCPNVPSFPGIDKFNGRILHSHEFRDAREFTGQRLLVVGASYSAEDIALQCLKYGAKHITCTWRSKSTGFHWPEGIDERPLVQRLDGNVAHFKDGSSTEVDGIILGTGYKYNFPFLDDDLRLYSGLSMYPDNLYKGSVWLGGGNRKLFYVGVQDQYYSFNMFDAQARWICQYITNQLDGEPRQLEDMRKDVDKWRQKRDALKDRHEEIDFQTEFMLEFCLATGYDKRCTGVGDLFHKWKDIRDQDIATYRDNSFESIFTKTPSSKHEQCWFKAFDDSLERFTKK